MEIKVKEEKKEAKYKRRFLILLLLFLLCIGCGIGFFIYSWQSEQNRLARENDAQEGNLPGMTADEIQKLMDEKVAEGSVQISINSKLEFPDGKSAGIIRIANSKNNHYLMVVEIRRQDNNELIYKSGAMKPGYYLEKDKLGVDLPKGEYPVTISFKNFDMKSEKYIGEAHAENVVRVLK